MKNGANIIAFWTTPPLPYLLVTVKVIELEKISFSAMQNLKTVFQHIDCRSQQFSS